MYIQKSIRNIKEQLTDTINRWQYTYIFLYFIFYACLSFNQRHISSLGLPAFCPENTKLTLSIVQNISWISWRGSAPQSARIDPTLLQK